MRGGSFSAQGGLLCLRTMTRNSEKGILHGKLGYLIA